MERLLTPATTGTMPRRVVLLADGGIADRVDHDGMPEIELLSRLCDLVRRAAGKVSCPRDSFDLLHMCAQASVESGSADAWKALYDDIHTKDIQWDRVRAFFTDDPTAPVAIVTALVGARDAVHLLHVACALDVVLPNVDRTVRQHFGRVLGGRLPEFVHAFVERTRGVRKDLRRMALTGLGKLLAVGEVPAPRIADLLMFVLRAGETYDEVATLFVHCPCLGDCLLLRPEIIPALLERGRRAPSGKRYPLLAVLVKMLDARQKQAAAAPAVVVVNFDAVEDLAAGTLAGMLAGGVLDARTTLVAALLAQHATAGKAAEDGGGGGGRGGRGGGRKPSLVEVLAKALESSSAALCRAEITT